jgi:DNA polymerase IV
VFLPGRMERYVELSERIREIFDEFTPLVEPLSLDEAYLDVTGCLGLFGPALELGRLLKQRVRERTGLTISVGIGPTKMVAKIASALSKPDGLLEVEEPDVPGFLRPLPVGWLWGVGPTTAAALEKAGIRKIGDLVDLPLGELRARAGRPAAELRALASGHDPRRVEADRERKTIGEENTFARDLRDGREVRETIVAHAEAVARRLRAEGLAGRTVVLKATLARRAEPGRYPSVTRRVTLPSATDDGRTIAEAALRSWSALAPGIEIRLVGVSVGGLEPRTATQGDLFATGSAARRDSLNRALDAIASKFGEGALARGIGHVERAAPTEAIKRRRRPDEE